MLRDKADHQLDRLKDIFYLAGLGDVMVGLKGVTSLQIFQLSLAETMMTGRQWPEVGRSSDTAQDLKTISLGHDEVQNDHIGRFSLIFSPRLLPVVGGDDRVTFRANLPGT